MPKNKTIFVHPLIRTYRAPLFKLLGQNGIDFFFTIKDPGSPIIKEEVDNILKDFPCHYIQGQELNWLPVDGFAFNLFQILKYQNVIFSISTSVPFIFMSPLVKLLGKKLFLYEETWRYPLCRKLHYLVRPWLKFFIPRFVDGIIVAGTKAQEFVNKEYYYPIEKTRIATNTTVDLMLENGPEEARNSEFISTFPNKMKILYLGRTVKYKGLDLLIKSMKDLKNSELFVVGEGPYLEECKKLSTTMRLNQKVHFLGACSVQERKAYFKACDVFVLPSRFDQEDTVSYESWGFTVNEAMAMEKPVVSTSAVGSAYDLIINGLTGYQVEQGNVQELTLALLELEQLPNKRLQMGQQARQKLLKTTDYQKNLEAFLQILNQGEGATENEKWLTTKRGPSS